MRRRTTQEILQGLSEQLLIIALLSAALYFGVAPLAALLFAGPSCLIVVVAWLTVWIYARK